METILSALGRRRDLWGGLRHHYALCVGGRLSQELIGHGADVELLGPTRVSRPWTVARARRRLRALLRRPPGFDVVVCHTWWPQALFGPVARAAGLPLVFYLHNPTDGRHWTERWAALTVPDLVISVSRHAVESVRSIYPRARTEVLYSPIPWAETSSGPQADRAALRAELGADPEATVIIQASRMEPWKGHDQHLRALALLRDVPGWTCWMAGGAQRPHEIRFRADLERMVVELGLGDRVRFLGERRDVPRLLAAADVFCQANRGPEGFSMAFMEAFAAGLPIVTMALGGAPEIVDASCGVLVPPGDVSALADGLRRLILDPATRALMGAAARRRVWELCDPATQHGRLAGLLSGLVPRLVAD